MYGSSSHGSSNQPAEVFRKDLISAMKLPDSYQLQPDEYMVMTDNWKPEWEKGVQVPVNPHTIPRAGIREIREAEDTDFKLSKKLIKGYDTDGDKEETVTDGPEKKDATCQYDLDEVDVHWLQLINETREDIGDEAIDELTMERIIEECDTQCNNNMEHAMQTEEGLGIEYDEDVICEVCRAPDSEEGNEMVFCDKCDICVHQACYGIVKVPEGSWMCRTCALSIQPHCILCGFKGGAMKSTRSGTKWSHVSCALWVPEVSIGCVERMEPITKISQIPASRWALICVICRERTGACIQCSVKTCKTAYHVTCGLKEGLEMKTYLDDEADVRFRSYCMKHTKARREMDGMDPKLGSPEKLHGHGTPKKEMSKKEMTQEEKANERARRIQLVTEEFYRYTKLKDVVAALGMKDESETVDMVYEYWKLKRKSGHNRPLVTPTKEVGSLGSNEEYNLTARMKMFVHLRQDLERVRNLCYMVQRREKLSRQFSVLSQSIFRKQCEMHGAGADAFTEEDLAWAIDVGKFAIHLPASSPEASTNSSAAIATATTTTPLAAATTERKSAAVTTERKTAAVTTERKTAAVTKGSKSAKNKEESDDGEESWTRTVQKQSSENSDAILSSTEEEKEAVNTDEDERMEEGDGDQKEEESEGKGEEESEAKSEEESDVKEEEESEVQEEEKADLEEEEEVEDEAKKVEEVEEEENVEEEEEEKEKVTEVEEEEEEMMEEKKDQVEEKGREQADEEMEEVEDLKKEEEEEEEEEVDDEVVIKEVKREVVKEVKKEPIKVDRRKRRGRRRNNEPAIPKVEEEEEDKSEEESINWKGRMRLRTRKAENKEENGQQKEEDVDHDVLKENIKVKQEKSDVEERRLRNRDTKEKKNNNIYFELDSEDEAAAREEREEMEEENGEVFERKKVMKGVGKKEEEAIKFEEDEPKEIREKEEEEEDQNETSEKEQEEEPLGELTIEGRLNPLIGGRDERELSPQRSRESSVSNERCGSPLSADADESDVADDSDRENSTDMKPLTRSAVTRSVLTRSVVTNSPTTRSPLTRSRSPVTWSPVPSDHEEDSKEMEVPPSQVQCHPLKTVISLKVPAMVRHVAEASTAASNDRDHKPSEVPDPPQNRPSLKRKISLKAIREAEMLKNGMSKKRKRDSHHRKSRYRDRSESEDSSSGQPMYSIVRTPTRDSPSKISIKIHSPTKISPKKLELEEEANKIRERVFSMSTSPRVSLKSYRIPKKKPIITHTAVSNGPAAKPPPEIDPFEFVDELEEPVTHTPETRSRRRLIEDELDSESSCSDRQFESVDREVSMCLPERESPYHSGGEENVTPSSQNRAEANNAREERLKKRNLGSRIRDAAVRFLNSAINL